MSARRVAFFTDSFHEVNGVALTSREFVRFARRRDLPMFSVHAGPSKELLHEGSVTTFEFQRGPVRWNLEHDLAIDFLFLRYRSRLRAALAEFQPDLVHITGPSDSGILGAVLAYELGVPLVAAWHTNLHEFGARRLSQLLQFLPEHARVSAAQHFESTSFDLCMHFYHLAKLIFAPNAELVALLAQRTGRPAFLMSRGIDTELFSPGHRGRLDHDFVIGYVGRLSPEKNVRLLAEIEQSLIRMGMTNYRFLIVGHGSEHSWLSHVMQRAALPGILRGQDLTRAYASMDAFVFPSCTDTFGNVVLEAMASGVPAIVTREGGPQYLIRPGETGQLAGTADEFASIVLELSRDPERLAQMRLNARESAQRFSWDAVWEEVYGRYEICFPHADDAGTSGTPEPVRMAVACSAI
ncbi:MAG TPA: glycosyltransferase [Bryobacteraceae bacterium]|nr:glycosyltransferase [Bryobacteraceae bacterium]